MPLAWADRLAGATNVSMIPTPPHPAIGDVASDSAEHLISTLRDVVRELIEPAIASLRASESRHGSEEDCFRSAAGQHLRFRCCVYFSSLAASLLEWRFGVGVDYPGSKWPDVEFEHAPRAYGALARWLLQPPPLSAPLAVARADALIARAHAPDPDYNLHTLRQAATQLPGPLGTYVTRLVIDDVRGTLWRCEVSTAHTYLIFAADARFGITEDVLIDVSYKQCMQATLAATAAHMPPYSYLVSCAPAQFSCCPNGWRKSTSKPRGPPGYLRRSRIRSSACLPTSRLR